jgi:hypothetical protein
MTHSPEVQALLDKQAIYEVACRYCRGIDRLDLDLVRSCYDAGAREHHPGYEGDVDGFIAMVGRGLPRLTGTMHVIANHLVELDGDRARAETYVNAYHWGEPADDATMNFSTGSRYVDHLHRRDGAWRITERWCVRNWARTEVGSGDLVLPDAANGWPAPRRDRGDVVYAPLPRGS